MAIKDYLDKDGKVTLPASTAEAQENTVVWLTIIELAKNLIAELAGFAGGPQMKCVVAKVNNAGQIEPLAYEYMKDQVRDDAWKGTYTINYLMPYMQSCGMSALDIAGVKGSIYGHFGNTAAQAGQNSLVKLLSGAGGPAKVEPTSAEYMALAPDQALKVNTLLALSPADLQAFLASDGFKALAWATQIALVVEAVKAGKSDYNPLGGAAGAAAAATVALDAVAVAERERKEAAAAGGLMAWAQANPVHAIAGAAIAALVARKLLA